MKYCSNCGNPVNENQDVCLNCGVVLKKKFTNQPVEEGSTGGWAVLGFFFPLVGLILYLAWIDTKPKSAKAAGKGAIIGFIVGIVLTIILLIILFSLMAQYYFALV